MQGYAEISLLVIKKMRQESKKKLLPAAISVDGQEPISDGNKKMVRGR